MLLTDCGPALAGSTYSFNGELGHHNLPEKGMDRPTAGPIHLRDIWAGNRDQWNAKSTYVNSEFFLRRLDRRVQISRFRLSTISALMCVTGMQPERAIWPSSTSTNHPESSTNIRSTNCVGSRTGSQTCFEPVVCSAATVLPSFYRSGRDGDRSHRSLQMRTDFPSAFRALRRGGAGVPPVE